MDESESQHSQQFRELEEQRESLTEREWQMNKTNSTMDWHNENDKCHLNIESNQVKSLTSYKGYNEGGDNNNMKCQCAVLSANESVECVPKHILLRHRLGYSMLELNEKQRAQYTIASLENYLLYKEHKYNAVNTLGRFGVFALLIMTFAVFCEIFSMSSSTWVEIRYYNYYESIGILVSCTGTTMHSCTRHANKLHSRSIYSINSNNNTILLICNNTLSFVTRYVILLYIFGIVELIFEIVALFGFIHIALRPTRSRAVLVVIYALLANVVCHVINCVLFAIFTRCARQSCTARNEIEPVCVSQFDWGYKVYIAAAALNLLSCLVMTCMHSFLFNLHWNSSSQLCQARNRRQCKEPEIHCASSLRNTHELLKEEQWKQNTCPQFTPMESMINTNCKENNLHPFSSQADNDKSDRCIIENKSKSRKRSNIDNVTTLPWRYKYDDIANHSNNILDNNVIDDEKRNNNKLHRHSPKAFSSIDNSITLINNDKSCKRSDDVSKTRVKRTPSKVQKRGNVFARLLSRDFDPNYLTAKELGVRIPHANDWVYDDRSDMFYSFSINSFYDPLSGEYYNVALKTWQDKVY